MGIATTAWELKPALELPPGYFFENCEANGYMLRVLEFRDCVAAGYVSPQWCTDFRQGFGSPYFGYYQPGFFYAASLFPTSLSLVHRVLLSFWMLSLVGYSFTFLLVARRVCAISGAVAATALALSHYLTMDLYFRGDFSEASAMMLVPVVLYWLDGSLVERRFRDFLGLALSSGLLVTMHPCVSLATFGYLALALLAFALRKDCRRAALTGLLALACGAGLAAFYWFPVFGEWRLVSPERAFAGNFKFAFHFREPFDLIFDRSGRHESVELGPALLVLLAAGLASGFARWRSLTLGHKRLVLLTLGMCAYSVFLMSSSSAGLWENIPLLSRLQFPWRLMTLTTVGAAILAGCQGPFKRRSSGALVLVWAIANLWIGNLADDQRKLRKLPFDEPQSAAEIAMQHFAPDIADEWLPRLARIDRHAIVDRRVAGGPGCEASDYYQQQGVLRCRVRADADSYVDLPHIFFPVGWTADVDGKEVPVEPNAEGLMRVRLPAGTRGRLKLEFAMTPMRRLGLLISGASVVVMAPVLFWASRQARRS